MHKTENIFNTGRDNVFVALETLTAEEAHEKLKFFAIGCVKIISHDSVDMVTLRAWCMRNNLDQIFDDISYCDSTKFYTHVMKERGSNKCKMSVIVDILGWPSLREYYQNNSHGALGDAVALCKLSMSPKLMKRFLGWSYFDQKLNFEPVVSQRRSQSVARFIPG